jgi:bifunctional DNA primase/polymerase-like protein
MAAQIDSPVMGSDRASREPPSHATVNNIVPRPMVAYALDYAERGWHVFPVHTVDGGSCSCGKSDCSRVGKHPIAHLAPRGFKDATIDPQVITQWWAGFPDANIGIATGHVSCVLVLDVDGATGLESLRQLEAQHGPLSASYVVKTGSGGLHFYFSMPNVDIRISASKLGAGLDVRANGGYVVAAPSLHHSGARYEVIGNA